MQINGEVFYETRPWKIYGAKPGKGRIFQGHTISKLGPKDIRFTRNKANNVVHMIALAGPRKPSRFNRSDLSADTKPGKVPKIEFLGTGEKVDWKPESDALRVGPPKGYRPKVDYAAVLKLNFA